MKNMNAKHTLLYAESQQIPGGKNLVARIRVHRWKCGMFDETVMHEEVYDGSNDFADNVYEKKTILGDIADYGAQRIGMTRFDGLVAEFGAPDDDLFPF
jgi:hypothetical protein